MKRVTFDPDIANNEKRAHPKPRQSTNVRQRENARNTITEQRLPDEIAIYLAIDKFLENAANTDPDEVSTLERRVQARCDALAIPNPLVVESTLAERWALQEWQRQRQMPGK